MISVDTAGIGMSAAIAAPPAVPAQPIPLSEATDTAKGRSSSEHAQSGHSNSSNAETEKRFSNSLPVIAGPSPAFEASLLELEADIENVIKRVYAEREQSRSGDAVKLDQEAPSPPETKVDSTAESIGHDDTAATPYDAASEQTEG